MSGIDHDDIVRALRCACHEAGGQAVFAKKHSLARAYVWGVLNGIQQAGPGILNVLGYRRYMAFEKMEKRS